MFDETKKYKNNGHFFFKKGDSLKEVSRKVPDLPGIHYIVRLSGGRIDLVYIGKSGTMKQNGKFNDQGLKISLNSKHDGIETQDYFESRILKESIDAFDIYWFVTIDSKSQDLPSFAEGLLIQRFFELYGKEAYGLRQKAQGHARCNKFILSTYFSQVFLHAPEYV